MQEINQLIIEGKMVRNPEFRATPKGTKFAVFQVANNKVYKDANGDYQNEVSYFEAEAWGERFCESIARNATKGRGLRLVGRLKQSRWKTDDGKTTSKVYLVAEHIEFMPLKNKGQQSEAPVQAGTTPPVVNDGAAAEIQVPVQDEEIIQKEPEAVTF